MEPNFSGYVTRYGVRCSDGRVIQPGAFKHQDGLKVPLIYQHKHDDISQVLGYTILSAREDGIWGDSFLNANAKSQEAGEAVKHGDLDMYSIWAKDLDEQIGRGESLVHDGVIQETSLVLRGANAGANIYNVLAHGAIDADEVMVIVGGEIVHAEGGAPEEEKTNAEEKKDEAAEPPVEENPAEGGNESQAEVLETLSDDQRAAVNQFIEDLIPDILTEALAEDPQLTHTDSSTKGTKMSRNQFDRSNESGNTATKELKHSDVVSVLTAAKGSPSEGVRGFNEGSSVGSLRDFIRSAKGKELMHEDTYGVQNLEILFPDAQKVLNSPTWVDRRQEWVKTFLGGTSHSPFSRIKTQYADITADEARARGYIKGNQKVEEVFPVFQRTTGPAWIYKKQKLDRQDIIDIVDFDVVAWMKAEMRGKLDEEIARAGLFGDGRPVMVDGKMNPDKIQEPSGTSGDGIRSVFNDDELYATRYYVPMAATPDNDDWNGFLDSVTEAGEFYLGSGNKTAFVSYRVATKMLTLRNPLTGTRVYRNLSEVAGDMDVNKIERVPTELMPEGCLAIVLDLSDYNFGTNRGGEITLFDDFDIDFNQYKYLIETYLSGALTLPYSAQIFMSVDPAEETLVDDFVLPAVVDNVITIPTKTGVVYKRTDTDAVVAGGTTLTLNDTTLKQVEIEATPASGYYFETDDDRKDSKTYRYKAPSA